jgi:hypothetical protein
MDDVPDDVLHHALQFAECLMASRTVSMRFRDVSMRLPAAFLASMDPFQRGRTLRACEDEGHVVHVAERCDQGRPTSVHAFFAFRHAPVEHDECCDLSHFHFPVPATVTVAAIRSRILARMPTQEELADMRMERMSLDRSLKYVRGVRRRVVAQMQSEEERIAVLREQSRNDLRNALLKRLLVRRVADATVT